MSAEGLTDFLLARIAEDEAVARAASVGPWTHDDTDGEVYYYSKALHSGWLISHPPKVADADHIARHDPARVLAECEAKRQIVDEATGQHTSSVEGYAMMQIVATVYADHPDYRESWRP